jgi:hypothetical protein
VCFKVDTRCSSAGTGSTRARHRRPRRPLRQ